MFLQKYFPILLFIASGAFVSRPVSAQVIYVTKYNDVELKVFVTEYKADADLVVYKTNYKSEAEGNEGIWYFTERKGDADRTIRFVRSRRDAELVIYYTLFKNDAGWVNKNKRNKL